MSHRRADVWLPAGEARCVPSRPCTRLWNCARYLAPIPPQGARVADFSIQSLPPLVPVPCVHWCAVQRPPASPPPPRRVHPPLAMP